jgi:acyl-CoA thioesterase I
MAEVAAIELTALERLVRYCHPAKLLDGTGLEVPDAALYDAPPETCRALADAIRARAVAEVETLRGAPLPFASGARLLAIGDSHTDDLGSWAQMLALLHDGPVINAGVSGDTTVHARARVDRLPRADHAIVLLGTNDARRHEDAPMLVSHAETRRALRALDRALRRFCGGVTWITPPPVDEQRLAADPWLAAGGVGWRLADVAAKAGIVRDLAPAVDLWPAFGPGDLAADGLHPSPAGQRFILECLLASGTRASGPRTP